MQKICLVIHSLGIGGMERVMAELANNFSAREDVQVHIILIGRKREVAYQISELVTIHKPNFRFQNKRRHLDTLRTIVFLRTTVKRINPDTVLSFGELWNNLVLIALKGLDVPIYISDRSQPDKNLGQLHNYLRRQLYPKAEGYIAQTEKAREICLTNGWNTNVEVIGNPIRSIKREHAIQKDNIVLSVGRLIDTKHFDQLIKIFVEVAPPGWRLMIVGGDAKKQNISSQLYSLVKELNADGQVQLEGEQSDIHRYYNRSKIFAFTSSSEGFPNVIGEALSAGLPVVAYDCIAGPSEMIVDNKNGFLVPLFDQEKFKRKLKQLMNDEQLRNQMSEKCAESISHLNSSDTADRFFSFITINNHHYTPVRVGI
ncbi:glycosyltransferase [Fodinibius sp. N2]|uniref:glycosyltransferase n=1 Tax=Fodinibius alkaliphilus TaxID=3140241 RepID=UPI00315AA0D5